MPDNKGKTDKRAIYRRMLAAALILTASAAGWVAVRYSYTTEESYAVAEATNAPKYIKAYVTGGVESPGIYDLPEGSRVTDAVDAAGGLSVEADLEALDLARLIKDGDTVRVPLRERQIAALTERVDINLAGFDELISVPGLEEGTALDIIAYREKYGAFKSVGELMESGLIDRAEFYNIEPYITAK